MSFLGFLKKLILFILIVAIAIPLRYGSTNHKHLLIRVLHSILSLKHSLVPDQTRPTLSADYRAFENLFRLGSVPDPDPLADPLPFIKNMRSELKFDTIIPKPSHCQVNQEIFEHDGHTVDTYWVDHRRENVQKKSDKILLYLHGGGYIAGDIHGYSGFQCHLSQLFNLSVLHVEYRLCPEHPLPTAVEDSVAVYRALLRQNISSSQLFIMGDSAGGGLALLTVQVIITHQLPVPSGVIALSPWTDLSMSGENFIQNGEIELIFTACDIELVTSQMSGPGFPSMYINVGTAEILKDDAKRVLKKAQDAGVNVTFEEDLHPVHTYQIRYPYFPEAQNTSDNINKWIQMIFTEKHTE